MNTAIPFPRQRCSDEEEVKTTFHALFQHAPMAVAWCDSEGEILEMNPAFEHRLAPPLAANKSLCLHEVLYPLRREKTDQLLRALFDSGKNSIGADDVEEDDDAPNFKWTAWREADVSGRAERGLLFAEQLNEGVPAESLTQTRRWEAIGRLAGGVVHDFNNLLTGVMLYCDLLRSSIDPRDRRRRYVDEIRAAILQASGLVRQLLTCARPAAGASRLVSLNEIAETMRDLLTRLVGDTITLDLRLDPELGSVKMVRAQAQQILLNLVLNARDALPNGGRITIETSNCGFRPVSGSVSKSSFAAFPCVLLTVADNGEGMDVETRSRLFEPFFTTKPAKQGSGLGLTTVRGIVTTNDGLIHFESEPGQGTRAMILFPRSSQPADTAVPNEDGFDLTVPPTAFQPDKKESNL